MRLSALRVVRCGRRWRRRPSRRSAGHHRSGRESTSGAARRRIARRPRWRGHTPTRRGRHDVDVGDVAWSRPGQVQPVCGGDRHGVRVHLRGGLRARADGGAVGATSPQRGGQLRARRVVGAHEQHALGRKPCHRSDVRRRCRLEGHIAPPPITLRRTTRDQAGPREHVEMEREQVRSQSGQFLQLRRRAVARPERVDDGQPTLVAQRAVNPWNGRARRLAPRSVVTVPGGG